MFVGVGSCARWGMARERRDGRVASTSKVGGLRIVEITTKEVCGEFKGRLEGLSGCSGTR